jgi:hypothetical protein
MKIPTRGGHYTTKSRKGTAGFEKFFEQEKAAKKTERGGGYNPRLFQHFFQSTQHYFLR